MITHAAVAKLNQHLFNDEFARVLRHLEAALDEGSTFFELDVNYLAEPMKVDLLEALCVMGYEVDYDTDREMFDVSIP